MSIAVPISIKETSIQAFLASNLVIRLYSNDLTPDSQSVLADFTEVTGGGYSAVSLLAASWTFSTLEGLAIASQSTKTFSFTGVIGGSGNVYGYYVTDAGGTVLKWAEALPGSISPFTPVNGSQLRFVPQFIVG